MNQYRIVIRNEITDDIELIMELRRRRFTKREYNMAIQELFMLAAINCDYSSLLAEIYCDDEHVMALQCHTLFDGSQVLSTISMGDKHIRTATLAA